MKIYLAGPMTGIKEYNATAFDRAALALRAQGHRVFNPIEADRERGFDPRGTTGKETLEELAALGFHIREAMLEDLTYIIEQADAIAVLPGWEKSKGVRAEVALAEVLGTPVAYASKFTRDGFDRPIEHPMAYFANDAAPTITGAQLSTSPGIVFNVTNDIDVDKAVENVVQEAQRLAANSISVNGEVRVTSSTGGEKGSKPQRYDLIPVEALAILAELYGRGAEKYEDNNWRRGYNWSLSYAAMMRHANQFWGGQDNDDETGLPHLASVAWHALTLLTFMTERRQFDDRYSSKQAVTA